MPKVRLRCALPAVLLLASGCANIAPPNLLHPGGIAYQRWRGAVYDPYPQTDIGPEMVGGRPYGAARESTPPPEPQRTANNLYQRFGPPPPKYSTFVP